MNYQEFLKTKELKSIEMGFDVDKNTLNDKMFNFQKDICAWALKKGKSAVLIGCGCGKSLIQLEWAHRVNLHTNKNVLIIAPLSVVNQTYREAQKFGIPNVNICRTQDDVKDGINITNYGMIEHFNTNEFIGVVLDESSILKSFTSKTTAEFTDRFYATPYDNEKAQISLEDYFGLKV